MQRIVFSVADIDAQRDVNSFVNDHKHLMTEHNLSNLSRISVEYGNMTSYYITVNFITVAKQLCGCFYWMLLCIVETRLPHNLHDI